MTRIRNLGYFVVGQGRIETWPAGVGLKFRVGAEQLAPARSAEIDSFRVIVPIFILVWRLRFPLAQDLELSGAENLSPLGVTQRDLLPHRGGLDLSANSMGVSILCNTESRRKETNQKQL